MAGLPKKYAKMGFKRGWAAYKKTKRSSRRSVKPRTKTRYKTMARRRSYRRVYRKARSGGGSMKPIIDGILAGAGGTIANKYVGNYGQSLANIGVGYFRNNPTLKTVGAIQLGSALAGQFFGGNGNGSGVFS